jgi:hypothetical protein
MTTETDKKIEVNVKGDDFGMFLFAIFFAFALFASEGDQPSLHACLCYWLTDGQAYNEKVEGVSK